MICSLRQKQIRRKTEINMTNKSGTIVPLLCVICNILAIFNAKITLLQHIFCIFIIESSMFDIQVGEYPTKKGGWPFDIEGHNETWLKGN